ncbi:2Fe-2S iron-sulfur cluster-binding protein [Streptomyces sp. enrichment culture]|uniref:2Fe-2S iron-sulfur cluster-binding protein n=1 Tax=Streptomyces sp. enrichment culture TaxID=1795815 RepID=UPI003F55C235
MTDDQHGEGTPRGGGRWDPLPQGDYDDGATAFVKLPEGGVDALLDSLESPLAAPGHGYVPPQITVAPATTGTDPAATGTWPVPGAPADGAGWHDPRAAQAQAGHPGQEPGADAAPRHTGQDDRFTYDPGASGQWGFEEAPAAENPAPGHDVTGQWSIPVAGGDLPDESGEFTTSALVEQWGGNPPATLPGGAPAPWATQAIGQPWGPGVPGVPQEQDGAHPDAQPGPDDASAPRYPAGPDGYGGQPARDGAASGQRAGEHGSEWPGAAGHAPVWPDAGHAPEPPAADHAPEQPAHAGPRSSGAPQPFATEGYAGSAAQPQWETGAQEYPGTGAEAVQEYPGTGAEAADGASAGLREHPHPGSQDASGADAAPEAVVEAVEAVEAAHEAAETAHEALEAAHGASEAVQGQAEPSADTDRTGPEADAGPEPAADDDGAPAAGSASPGTATAQDTPDPAGSPDASDAPGDPAPSEAPAPDGSAPPHDPPPGAPYDDHPLASYVLRVNGSDRPVTDAWIGESLLYVLRERLGLAGAKDGCSQGECGACNVQVDGRLVASCLVPAVTAAGSEVRTVEGLAQDGRPSDVQRALARCGAVQCGFCVPGMAMTVHDLLEGNPAPTELETRQALCGNLCRCSGYRGVVEAVKEVVAEREAHAAAPEPESEPGPGPDTDADAPRIPHQAGPGAGGVNPSAFGPTGPHDPHDQPYGQDGGQA